jgi:hypothetical protein
MSDPDRVAEKTRVAKVVSRAVALHSRPRGVSHHGMSRQQRMWKHLRMENLGISSLRRSQNRTLVQIGVV